MSKRIQLQTGYMPEETIKQTENVIEKRALLVYAGKFESAEGPVEITPEQIKAIADRHNGFMSKFKRLAGGEVPAKVQPPIQLDHSPSAEKTVGRLIGDVELGEYAPDPEMPEATVPALYGAIRIMGKENVERVADGRWTCLSIGADLDDAKLSEVTITPFPAAPGASFLSRAKLGSESPESTTEKPMEGEKTMGFKEAKEAMAKYSKIKEHLCKTMQMTEEDAEKKLEGMSDEEMTKMEGDIHVDIVPGGQHTDAEIESPEMKAKMAKLSAIKTRMTELSAKMVSTQDSIKLQSRKTKILARLSAIKAQAKITPAEIKKIDLVKLSKASDEAVDAVLSSYESREPVILTGVYGSAKAVNAAEIARKVKMSALEKETRANMTSVRKTTKLTADSDADDMGGLAPTMKMGKLESKPEPKELLAKVKAFMAEGKDKEAEELLEQMMMPVAQLEGGEQVSTSMGEVQKEVDELGKSMESMKSEFDETAKLMAELV